MNDREVPRRILPDRGQYVCPGSVFIPMRDGRCICGHSFGAHMHYNANGIVYDVPSEVQQEYLSGDRE